MDKSRGLTLGALFAAAAVMLRPSGPSMQQALPGDPARSEAALIGLQPPIDGPWIASCNYWAPLRDPSEGLAAEPAEISGTLGAKPLSLRLPLQEFGRRRELGCRGESPDRWGLPKSGPVNITAIIATAPDPVHTHLALSFDRAVDAMLQAAADNGYVSTYYWTPWRNRGSALKVAEAQTEMETGHDPERERQPGLIVLKHIPEEGEPANSAFYRVVYLFLVGETPTQGVDGYQLQNALSYERELQTSLGGAFSSGEGSVAIVGPAFSGSAASLRAGIDAANSRSFRGSPTFEIAGATTTDLPATELSSGAKIEYRSFADHRDFDIEILTSRLSAAGYDITRFALLVEDNTSLGTIISADIGKKGALVIRFPREISLLRNAESAMDKTSGAAGSQDPAASPYLHFSIKDSNAHDSVSIFSRENTPLSQEAQLMTIARQLHRYRSQFIAIVASNTLDQIFLAQFLHRACPDATLVFFAPDLLLERDIDNLPFVGSITITPYPLIGLGRNAGSDGKAPPPRTEPASASYAYYNAASYTFWRNGLAPKHAAKAPILQGYHNLLNKTVQQPNLWATAIGSDGYYPLGVISACSSDSKEGYILPAFGQNNNSAQDCVAKTVSLKSRVIIYPSRVWDALCALVLVLCLFHILMLYAADYWSPYTRDLAIRDNDHPRRRSLYAHVSTAMLLCMAWALSFPALWLAYTAYGSPLSILLSLALIVGGLWALGATLAKTRHNLGFSHPEQQSERSDGFSYLLRRGYANAYLLLNLFVLAAALGAIAAWAYACCTGSFAGHSPDLTGMSFAFRCINPSSGVSPLEPALLLFFGWYLWGVMQSRRLRFSTNARPRLPRALKEEGGERLFVSDDELERCEGTRDSCLYENITCLFITRKLLGRLMRVGRDREEPVAIDAALILVYGGLLVWLCIFTPIRGIDHFVLHPTQRFSSPYEFLFAGLFFPLIAISLAGWLRMIVIWASLKRGLLDRLESLPIRFAFDRIKVTGWMTMLRQSGLQDHWRDMARSLESMRQMLHQTDLQGSSGWQRLQTAHQDLQEEIAQIRLRIAAPARHPRFKELDFESMRRLENRLAQFSEILLATILIPFWKNERTGLVASKDAKPRGLRGATPPARILVAEEYLAIRYISLIRAVLANLRYLMTFASISFVLVILAWNSYPFQPRQVLDWFFTALMAFLGAGVVWVFAQMHRDPILSRITDTKENELGFDFYLRVISFGALPVATWLAYQFPQIGGMIYRFLQPVEPVIK